MLHLLILKHYLSFFKIYVSLKKDKKKSKAHNLHIPAVGDAHGEIDEVDVEGPDGEGEDGAHDDGAECDLLL